MPDLEFVFVVAVVDDHARKIHTSHGFTSHQCMQSRIVEMGQSVKADQRHAALAEGAFGEGHANADANAREESEVSAQRLALTEPGNEKNSYKRSYKKNLKCMVKFHA